MPLYEYQCEKCGRFELIKKFSDDPVLTCPTCGAPVQKLFSSPAIQFKGTGWYVTDYAKSGARPGAGGKSEGKSEGSKESGSTAGSKDSGTKDSASKDSSAKGASGSGTSGGKKSGS